MNRTESPEINPHTYDIKIKHKNSILDNKIKHMKYLRVKADIEVISHQERSGKSKCKGPEAQVLSALRGKRAEWTEGERLKSGSRR